MAKIWQNLDFIFLKCSQHTELHFDNTLFEFKYPGAKHDKTNFITHEETRKSETWCYKPGKGKEEQGW